LLVVAVVLVGAGCSGSANEANPARSEPSTPAPTSSTTTTTLPPLTEESRRTVSLAFGGSTRTYDLFIPGGVVVGEPMALVVDLHGLAGTPQDQDALSGMTAKAAAEGFVVAHPAGAGFQNAWEVRAGSADVAFLRAVVDDISAQAPIDPERVFATGMSNGGGMVHRLACDAADVFSAVAPVAGAHVGSDLCDPSQPVSVIAFHGTFDLVVAYDGFIGLLPAIPEWAEAWADRMECRPDATSELLAPDVVTSAWAGCRSDVEVVLHTVEEGRHGWPGTPDGTRGFASTDSVSATDLIWEFFVRHGR
jgi:polyhydroxybutyrate depolymerase